MQLYGLTIAEAQDLLKTKQISAQELTTHLAELEAQGFTTIAGVLSAETIERAKRVILDRVEAATGQRIDPQTATAADYEGMTYLPYLLYDDEVFEEIMRNVPS